jgi:hypothetical protein
VRSKQIFEADVAEHFPPDRVADAENFFGVVTGWIDEHPIGAFA